MGLTAALHRQRASTVMGIDASTHSLAFAVFKDTKLSRYGKINFVGNTAYARLADAKHKMDALKDTFDVDYIAIEKAIMVRNMDTAIKLGMVVGVIIASLIKPGTTVVEVAPITWQCYINNPNYSTAQKATVRRRYPRKSAAWRRNFIREARKQKTLKYFNKAHKLKLDDNDVGDALGLAWYAVNNLTR